MHQISIKTSPTVFFSKFKKPSYLYPIRFSNVSFIKSTHKFNKCKYRMTYIRGSCLWNEFLTKTEKKIESTSSFKIVVKDKLLLLYNELSYF